MVGLMVLYNLVTYNDRYWIVSIASLEILKNIYSVYMNFAYIISYFVFGFEMKKLTVFSEICMLGTLPSFWVN